MDFVWYNFPCPGWGSHWQKSHKGQVKMLNKLSGVFITLSEFGLQILIFLYKLSIGTFTCLLCDHYLRSVENIQNLVVRSALLRLSAFTTSFPTYTYRFTELDEHLFTIDILHVQHLDVGYLMYSKERYTNSGALTQINWCYPSLEPLVHIKIDGNLEPNNLRAYFEN